VTEGRDAFPASFLLKLSVVTYGRDASHLRPTLESTAAATAALPGGPDASHLVLVDNGPYGAERHAMLRNLLSDWQGNARILSGHGNVGYGRGHNLALSGPAARYHLVLNPDVELAPDALERALDFMERHPDCGLLAPAVRDERGGLQYLCKRYPAVLDLLIRGFAPEWLRRPFRQRLERYEMRDVIGEHDVVWDPPIVSGCFMLFRAAVLMRLGGFDPRYFLYFEDFDLSLRAARECHIAYVPTVRIVHHGGGAARKGMAHTRMFAVSAWRFFATHGWRWV
jgi:hypothetical protein